MNYNFTEIERKWQEYWSKNKTFRADNNSENPKFYVLDMFPYPSGKGLHVGHPLGYIASDIYSRYKRLRGYNVLHPMGYDAFGLPAEQYAIETGQHPAIITRNNIKRYREQMDKLGFSYDWDREVKTCDAQYYKWTQWIFLKLFNSWYNPETDKAEPIDTLIPKLKNYSTLSEKEKSDLLMNYRLAYLGSALVNWCPKLGTVLANEEVKDGLSDRGGYPVERRLMPQWSLRITAYADRLLNGLEKIDWSESIKEAQRNWIGRSEGSSLEFKIQNSGDSITVFTTRPDTTFGVTFLTLAPENDLVEKITTKAQKQIVNEYIKYAKSRSERERQAEVKKVTGQFTGAYAIHPFSGEKLPVWIGEYVLPGYGTGAVMGVPAHDTRDFAFAKHFGLEIKKVIFPDDKSLEKEECFDTYDGYAINSDFINGLQVRDAIKKIISEIEKRGLGRGQTQYRLRDAIFGRQRYWGEPIPIYYKGEIPNAMDESELPLILPEVDKYLPTESGEPPLANAKGWKYKNKFEYEKTTMPGWAASSWYYLRYMDAQNKDEFVSKEAVNYWRNVDLYIGGAEHATGHLLYVRFWTKFLFDMGYLPFDEPAKKLINQGMILGENGEKMSKSKGNIINPDELIEKYGADTLRMYEMFIGPLEQHKPWDTKGIEGVFRFLKKLWRLYHDDKNNFSVYDVKPTGEELKILHKAIKKIKEDIERYSFNTGVSAMMICVNDLTELKCNKKNILEDLLIIVSPYAPHIAECLWSLLGNTESISKASFPGYEEKYLVEMTYNYPVSFNGKMRFTIELPLSLPAEEIERAVLTCERSKKWLNGKKPEKVIIVPKKVVNIVV